MADRGLIEGVPLRLQGRDYLVPSLNFKRLRLLLPKLQKFTQTGADTGDLTDEFLADAIDIIHTALTQNYPDLTRDFVEELVTLESLRRIMPVIMGAAGMIQSGEAEPATATATPPA